MEHIVLSLNVLLTKDSKSKRGEGEMGELKPCPNPFFPCGGKGKYIFTELDCHWIECDSCGLRANIENSYEKAVQAWDTRCSAKDVIEAFRQNKDYRIIIDHVWCSLYRLNIDKRSFRKVSDLLTYMKQEMEKALPYVDRAYQKDPSNPKVLLAVARVNHALENYYLVKKIYTELKELDPDLAFQFSYLDLRGEEASRAAEIGKVKGMIVWAEE